MSIIYSKYLNNQLGYYLSAGDNHNCAFFISPFTCFLIEFNDSSVCSGNGIKKIKNKKIILKKNIKKRKLFFI
jgi:hypothetical protein